MMEFVKFIGQDYDHFLGFLVAVGVIAYALVWVISAIRGRI